MDAIAWIDALAIASYVVFATRIAFFDTRHQLVRNSDVVLGVAFLFVLNLSRGLVVGSWDPLLASTISAVAYGAVYGVLARWGRGQLGTGDVGLGIFLGLFLGSWSLGTAVIGWATPFALAALPSALVWWLKGRKSFLAFGPFIVLSAPLTLLIAGVY